MDPSIRPKDLAAIDPAGRLASKTIRAYGTAGGGTSIEKVYPLDVAVFDVAGEVILDWQRLDVSVEPTDDETPVSGWLPFRWGYTATNPGPPMQAHIGSTKTVVVKMVQAGQLGG